MADQAADAGATADVLADIDIMDVELGVGVGGVGCAWSGGLVTDADVADLAVGIAAVVEVAEGTAAVVVADVVTAGRGGVGVGVGKAERGQPVDRGVADEAAAVVAAEDGA